MADYNKSTNFAAKDTLPIGNPAKVVRGTEIDAEFSAISTAVNSKADTTATTASLALKADKATTVTAGTGLTGGGDLSTNRTISLATGGVATASIADSAVTAAKLASNSVTTAKIADASVTAAKLANGGNELGFRNRIINGDMRIDQRNSGASVFNAFAVDRFFGSKASATATYARSTTAPAGFTSSLSLTVTTGAATGATDGASIQQGVEGFNISDFGWGTANAQAITLSFWARSSATGNYGVSLRNGAANRSYVAAYTINAANTWEYKTLTIAGDTSGTWATDNTAGIYLNFDMGVGSTFSTTAGSWQAGNFFGLTGGVKLQATSGATFYITGVQLEAGTVATPFERRDYGRELMMCQRYFRTNGRLQGIWTAAQNIRVIETFPVEMRASPTLVLIDTNGYHEYWNNAGYNGLSSVGFTQGSSKSMDMVLFSSASRGRSYNDPAMLEGNVVSYNAEL